MAIILIEGFDHYNAATAAGKLTLGNGATINTASGRGGGGCLGWTISAVGASYIPLGGDYSDFIVGFAFLPGVSATTESIICAARGSDGVDQVYLRLTNSNQLYVTRGTSTIIGIGSIALPGNIWSYIEFRCKISDTSGVCQVWVNGALDINFSGDTRQSASVATANTISFRFGHYSDAKIDDLYVMNLLAAPHNARLGDCRVETVLPNGDGAASEWTVSPGPDHWDALNDSPPDGDSTFVQTDVEAEIDFFHFPDVNEATAVFALSMSGYAKKTGIAEIAFQLGAFVGSPGTEYYSDNFYLSTGYQHFTKMFEVNPLTDADWTGPIINNSQFGIRLPAL